MFWEKTENPSVKFFTPPKLRWKPKIKIEEGIKRTIDYYKKI